MAASIAYLSGGPCNGRKKPITQAEADAQTILCGGHSYHHTPGKNRPNGDLIFDDAGPVQQPRSRGNASSAPHAHTGWADLQRSVNKNWPKALNTSAGVTAASLRALGRIHKVKG